MNPADTELASTNSAVRTLVPTSSKEAIILDPTNRGVISTNSLRGPVIPGGPTPAAPNPQREDPLEVSMHWFAGTVRELGDLESVTGLGVAFISDVVGHSPDAHPRGFHGYTRTYEWNAGLKLMVNPARPEMGLYFLATGKACEFYGFDTLAVIGQALQVSPTRLDLAVDGCPFTPLGLHEHWLRGEVRTQAKPMKNAMPDRRKQRAHTWSSSPTGDNLHMGRGTSTQSARCYNLRGFTRFEMMLRDDRAAQVMRALYGGAELGLTLGAVISQFVAFVELDDSNRSRCTLLPFWARFMERLNSNGVVTRLEARPALTRERLRCWMRNTVSPSLATYAEMESEFEGPDAVLEELRQEGQKRMRSKHHALVAACKGVRPDADAPLPEIVQDAPLGASEGDEPLEEDAA